jgi:hypothetical protein
MNKRTCQIAGLVFSTSVACLGLTATTSGTQSRFEDLHRAEGRQREGCTNRSLQGSLATMVQGYFLDAPAPVPLRSLALTYFDGRGHTSQVDHGVIGGVTPPVDWAPATGTYKVNPDCTGESELNIPGNPASPLTIRFVIADDGNQLLSVLSEPGTAITSTGTRLTRR